MVEPHETFRRHDSNKDTEGGAAGAGLNYLDLRLPPREHKSIGELATLGAGMRLAADLTVLANDSKILQNKVEPGSAKPWLNVTKDYLQSATKEASAVEKLAIAHGELQLAKANFAGVSGTPDRLASTLRSTIDELDKTGASPAVKRVAERQLHFVNLMNKTSPDSLTRMLADLTGTESQVRRAEKIFENGSARHALISEHLHLRQEMEHACINHAEKKGFADGSTLRRQMNEAAAENYYNKVGAHGLRGFLRGALGVTAATTGLIAADMLYKSSNGEHIDWKNHNLSKIMTPNEMDALGIGALSSGVMPLKVRIAAYGAVLVAGRGMNVINEYVDGKIRR